MMLFFSSSSSSLFPLFGWSFTQCSRLEGTNKESRQQPYKWHQLILKDRLIQYYVWFQASHRLVLFFLFSFAYIFLAYVFCFHNQMCIVYSKEWLKYICVCQLEYGRTRKKHCSKGIKRECDTFSLATFYHCLPFPCFT